ncbi:MAG: hypothetical protein SCH39_05430 [Methanosarcinales archaeon]|nr:hypothetical protein [Methanosarcinales archaeon]
MKGLTFDLFHTGTVNFFIPDCFPVNIPQALLDKSYPLLIPHYLKPKGKQEMENY